MYSLKSVVIIFAFACVHVSGCMNLSPTPDPSRFYTLTPLPQAEKSPALDRDKTTGLFVGLGPIRFPAYLDREQIVTRAAPNRLDVSEDDRWAEPLEENFSRVLSQNLGFLLGGARITRYPWQSSPRPTCQIEMEVLQFERSTSQEVQLRARWLLIDLSDKALLIAKESRITRQSGTKSMEASVAALSETLGDFSREIADTITARLRPGDHAAN